MRISGVGYAASSRAFLMLALTGLCIASLTLASKLYDAGCTSVDLLRLPRFHSMLLKPAQAGVLYHSVLQERVTREQAETVAVSRGPCTRLLISGERR